METDRLAQFEASRRRLFGLAYRLLGEAAEAEDVVQDAYLRWAQSHEVAVAEAWLIKVVTNLCLNRLTSARVRRERYVGPWLPEPVLTTNGSLGPLETVEQRDSVSIGMLVLLERLTPPERAVFVLREAFGYRHAEIAGILDVSEEHSRQLHRRARLHVGEQRKRFDTDGAQRTRILERFLAATMHGDLAGLEQLLAEDVVAWADGGGTTAARRPISGRNKVLRYLLGLATRSEAARLAAAVVEINGGPAIAYRVQGTLRAVTGLDSIGGRIVAVRTIINPDKLAFAAAQ
ncbi:MAG: RNA polymerase sigma factor SigJ [Pseudonocardiales bacterium]